MPNLAEIIINDAKQVVSQLDLSPLKDKRVSVVGASGIIGTYALAVLREFGGCAAVVGVATKKPEPWREKLANSWTITDVTSSSQAIVPLSDYILFGAGYGQPAKFMADPLKTLRINTSGLNSVFRSLARNGRMLYLSSSEIYSGNENPPYVESQAGNTTPQHPRACYIEAKRCGEAICEAHNAAKDHGITAVSARVALAYGPGTRKNDDRVINQFIRKALANKAINMRDDGRAFRTYCYVADCVKMLFTIWLRGKGSVYNVGGRSTLTIAELADKIGKLCGASVTAPPGSFDDGAPKVVNMSIAKYMIEFENPVMTDIDRGLERTIAWQKLLYEV